jgi:23S rRNA pseudouridine2605 synthase
MHNFSKTLNLFPVRLNKFIALSGFCSRRNADSFISSGKVQVNSQIITDFSFQVHLTDSVYIDSIPLKPQTKLYFLLHKPINYICSSFDPFHKNTVFNLIPQSKRTRLFSVGRLDMNTSGTLIITNDGLFSFILSHPSFSVEKIYHITLDKTLSSNDKQLLLKGIQLNDGLSFFDSLSPLAIPNSYSISLHSGKNRIIRRSFLHLGYSIQSLHRHSLFSFNCSSLKPGSFRSLSSNEINSVYNLLI